MVSSSTTNYSFCKDLIMLSASLYSFSSTYVTGLRHLTNVLLKKQIQNSLEGHCSTEDAEAALSLATSRAKVGNAFQLRENTRGKSLMRTFQTPKLSYTKLFDLLVHPRTNTSSQLSSNSARDL